MNSILIGFILKSNDHMINKMIIIKEGSCLAIAGLLTSDNILMITEGSEKAIALLADFFANKIA